MFAVSSFPLVILLNIKRFTKFFRGKQPNETLYHCLCLSYLYPTFPNKNSIQGSEQYKDSDKTLIKYVFTVSRSVILSDLLHPCSKYLSGASSCVCVNICLFFYGLITDTMFISDDEKLSEAEESQDTPMEAENKQ